MDPKKRRVHIAGALPMFNKGDRTEAIRAAPVRARITGKNFGTVASWAMIRIAAPFLLMSLFFLTGCQSPGSAPLRDAHYDETLRKIEALKTGSASTPSAGTNLRIVINKLSASVSDYTELEALWRYADRHVVIAHRPESFARSGLSVGVATDKFNAQLKITKGRLKSSEDSTLFLVVAAGATGFIHIGEQIVVPRFFYAGRFYRAVDYQFRQAGKSLQVTPDLLPSGAIRMELTPVFSKFLSAGGDVALTELTTTVTVQPGQTIVIGGGNSSDETVGTALFSYRKQTENGKTLVTVTAYVQ
jgi:hypothetical protein